MGPSSAFASDNAAPAHPAVLEAMIAANDGSVPSYGADPVTTRAAAALRSAFEADDAEVLFAFTGTGANIIALTAASRPWQEILCSDIAHALLDEAGGPVRLSGAQLTALPSADGILALEELSRRAVRRGDVHHSQPAVVTITQSTENGRVWTPERIAEFVDHAHSLDYLVHVDGARIANAVAALGCTPAQSIGDADIVTVGGTKNGAMFGDAVLVRRPELFGDIYFVQKQIGQLTSKQRFVAVQFEALLADGLWLRNAAQANAMAARLGAGLSALGVPLAYPREANEVFADLGPSLGAGLREHYALHRPDPLATVTRFVCSWSTTEAQVDELLDRVRSLA